MPKPYPFMLFAMEAEHILTGHDPRKVAGYEFQVGSDVYDQCLWDGVVDWNGIPIRAVATMERTAFALVPPPREE